MQYNLFREQEEEKKEKRFADKIELSEEEMLELAKSGIEHIIFNKADTKLIEIF